MSQTLWREPIEIAAGDTLSFSRKLGLYPASGGWSLKYELRGDSQVIEFTSTANANGEDHDLTVAAAVTATWLAGSYELAGYAVKAAERHQIYLGQLTIGQDLAAAAGDAETRTFAQKMIEQIEAVMLAKAGNDIAMSSIGETHFKYLSPTELRTEHGYWKTVRRQEVAMERAKAGLPTGRRIRPVFNIQGGGSCQQPGGYFG